MATELEPTAAERKLIAAAAKGTVADYRVGGAGWGEARIVGGLDFQGATPRRPGSVSYGPVDLRPAVCAALP